MSSESTKWFLIVNPEADDGRALRDYPRISQLLYEANIACDTHFTEYRHHAVELTVRAINEGYRNLIVVGGDGTLHEVVNGLFIQTAVPRTDIVLGVIAVGSGGNWAMNFGFSEGDYMSMVQAISAGRTFLQDIGVVSYEESLYRQERYMICAAGTGFDSYVVQRFSRRLLGGKRRRKIDYILCVVRSFFQYRHKSARIYADDKLVFKGLIFSVAVGIGRYKIGGVQQMPEALIDDGLLDMTIIKPLRFWHILFRFLYLYDGKIYRIGHVKHHQAERIRIESNSNIAVEIDGELWGEVPLEFSVLRRAVNVIVPATYVSSNSGN